MTDSEPSVESVSFDRTADFPLPTERRYPLDLAVKLPELRRLYHESNAAIWDVEAEFAASEAPSDLEPAIGEAAGLVWSRRAWLAFAGISESEAALVRCCIERDREADLKFVLAARGTEHAVAADACHRMARRFGAYREAPPTPELVELFCAEPIRRALDERVDFDAYFVAHFVALATVDRALLDTSLSASREPIVLRALEAMLVNSTRQQRAGLLYAEARLPLLDERARSAVADNVVAVIEMDVLSGLRCPAFLDPATPGAEELLEAESRAAESGLGAAPPDEQRRVAGEAIAHVGELLDGLGITCEALPSPSG